VPNCSDVYHEWQVSGIEPDLQVHVLNALYGSKLTLVPLRRLLSTLNVPYIISDSLRELRKKLKLYITNLRRGKRIERSKQEKDADQARFEEELRNLRFSWPQVISQKLKDKIINLFREQTSSEALATFTCASCAEAVSMRSHCSLSLSEFDFNILKRPDLKTNEAFLLDQYKYLHPDCIPPPMPFDDGPLRDLIDCDGVSFPDGGQPVLSLCTECQSLLKKGKLPPLSLANKTFLGPVPEELKNLTVIEEAMIARCRSKCWIIQLKEENQDLVLANTQHGIHGHIIIYPQQPSQV
jgi:hypothetical protein